MQEGIIICRRAEAAHNHKVEHSMKALFAGGAAVLTLVLILGVNQAGEKDKPKYTIKEVMKTAHSEGGLLEKVAEGTANAKEKAQLLEMYTALHKNVPPQGDKAKWAKITQTMVDAAKAVNDGKDEKAGATLSKLVNCKNCHGEFKPPKK
jgi:hypothetical protein